MDNFDGFNKLYLWFHYILFEKLGDKNEQKYQKQKLLWASIYNVIAIPIAFFGFLHPMIGMSAMTIRSINVVLNSISLNKEKID